MRRIIWMIFSFTIIWLSDGLSAQSTQNLLIYNNLVKSDQGTSKLRIIAARNSAVIKTVNESSEFREELVNSDAVIYMSSRISIEDIIKIKQFVFSGGRAIFIFSSGKNTDYDIISESIIQYFGVAYASEIVVKSSIRDELHIEGSNLLPFWSDLTIGFTTSGHRDLKDIRYNAYVEAISNYQNLSSIKSQQTEKIRALSISLNIGSGSLIVTTAPFVKAWSWEHLFPIMDEQISNSDNETATNELLKWLLE